jgi:hypothetical protein
MDAHSLSSVYSSRVPGRLMIQHAPLEIPVAVGKGAEVKHH